MSQFYVYEHLTKDTNKTFYVGKGAGYRSGSKSNRNKHWQKIVKKHGFTVNIIAKDLDEELAFLCEQERIEQLKKLGYKLCNYTNGGEGISGHKHSEQSKKKISKKAIGRNVGHTWNVGRKQSQEWKKNISKSLIGNKRRLGIPHTKESLEIIKFHSTGKNNPMYGKQQKDSTKSKISEQMSGRIRITNGIKNTSIFPTTPIPIGWYKGMTRKGSK
jgi:hypothetical protein